MTIDNDKIVEQQILSDYSILQSGSNNIEITIGIPDSVLTGSKYDIDIIINEPLEETIIAGGLIPLKLKEYENNKYNDIELKPMASGGLFKSVRVPLEPGTQTWAALIAHPQGLISVTKMVRIVSFQNELNP